MRPSRFRGRWRSRRVGRSCKLTATSLALQTSLDLVDHDTVIINQLQFEGSDVLSLDVRPSFPLVG